MKVIHIESGLGNQMLSYCEYLAMKKMNPNDDCYIETIIYDIPECNNVICQWNGYELDRIFHINAPNIHDILSPNDWDKLMGIIKESRFWEKNWNYPVYFTKAFHEIGIDLENWRGDFETKERLAIEEKNKKWYLKTLWYVHLKRIKKLLTNERKLIRLDNEHKLYFTSDKNIFTGQQLLFKYKKGGIDKIEKEIKETFIFPKITDKKNQEVLNQIKDCNSVALHARKGDMDNYECYHNGYFSRATNYIRKNVSNPVFFVFCDPGSVEWAKTHEKQIGLNFKKDHVHFVDWNKGTDSWRDMQLMTYCKHNIITASTFGWWGAWLNQNPDKITCSPDITINTTHYF